MIDFNIAKQSALRHKGELTKIFGVSFQMVSAYMNGRAYPRGKNRDRVTVAIKVLATLIEQGKLPFADDKDPEWRQRAVEKISEHITSKLTVSN